MNVEKELCLNYWDKIFQCKAVIQLVIFAEMEIKIYLFLNRLIILKR